MAADDIRPAVVVMVKAPRAGAVKTRLCPPLSPTEGAGLAACFALDTVANAEQAGAAVLVAYAPDDGLDDLAALRPSVARWVRQRGASLGMRMHHALEDAHAMGYGPLLIIGTDSPTLPLGMLRIAFATLSAGSADAVFGPTEDGGYYLAGMRRPIPGLFDDVAWSTDRALADTLRNAAALSLAVELLPSWYDVDDPDDLGRLRDELLTAAARARAPQTNRWLQVWLDAGNRLEIPPSRFMP